MINLPEKILHGTIPSAGRCEFTVTFFGKNILCFIEFKQTLPTNTPDHSDVVAQVIAEMDGADMHNRENQYDGCPIIATLTDGYSFEFYLANFKMWPIHRGVGGVEHGIYSDLDKNYRISIPKSERSPDDLPRLKTVSELIFDTFLYTYTARIISHI
jgi:hypothetical protein